MVSSAKSILAFGVGFVSGWAARSLADTPEGVGVKLLEESGSLPKTESAAGPGWRANAWRT